MGTRGTYINAVLTRGLLIALGLSINILAGVGCRTTTILTETLPAPEKVTFPDSVIHNELSKQVVLAAVPGGIQGSKGLGWVRPTDLQTPPFQRPQNEELRLAPGEPLDLYLILLNQIGKPRTFLVSALLDYKQISFELDGKNGTLHEVIVPSSTEMNLPLRLNLSGNGAHDLILIAFADPYDHPLDPNTRENEQGGITGRRAVIVVGDRDDPVQRPTPVAFGKDAPTKLPLLPIRIGFASAPNGQTTHPSERYITFAQVTPGQRFAYQIWATNFGNVDKDTFNYALVGFLDFHQIDLVQDGVTVVQVRSGQEAVLDASVSVPNTKGVHELQVVYVFDPFKSILRKEVLAPFVLSSLKLGLDAR